MVKFDYYIENVKDRAWFDSSNVIYGECDESDSQEKTVRLTFKNGLVYEYSNVNVYDWALFKGSDSQGKALNSIFKKNGYSYKKLDESMDVEKLQEELEFRSSNGMTITRYINLGVFTITNNKDEFVTSIEDVASNFDAVKQVLEALKYNIKVVEDNGVAV